MADNQLKTYDRRGTEREGCISLATQGIMVSSTRILGMHLLICAPVYLDNVKAVNDLLVKELDRQ